MKRLTKKPWFGPKYLGWGWRPITWEGWLSSIIFVLASIALGQKYAAEPNLKFYLIVFILIFVIFCYLTGNKPGSKLFDKKENK